MSQYKMLYKIFLKNNKKVCDNVSHCGHGEDEVANGLCAGSSISALLGVEVSNLTY